tara:strand:+ start:2149 stop:2403 length:255 start_codon:yes stop_codon:yes gene_type:complete
MFILLDKKTGGVYAVNDDNGGKVVQIFVDKDDADRYYSLLQADDYKRPLDVTEVDEQIVINNCTAHNYNYVFIQPDELVVPPQL